MSLSLAIPLLPLADRLHPLSVALYQCGEAHTSLPKFDFFITLQKRIFSEIEKYLSRLNGNLRRITEFVCPATFLSVTDDTLNRTTALTLYSKTFTLLTVQFGMCGALRPASTENTVLLIALIVSRYTLERNVVFEN